MSNLVKASALFGECAKEQFETLLKTKRQVEEDISHAQNVILTQIEYYLNNSPEEVLSIADISAATGLTKGMIRYHMKRRLYNNTLMPVKIPVTRQYAEIDDSGNIVPGGKVITQSFCIAGYQKRPRRQ